LLTRERARRIPLSDVLELVRALACTSPFGAAVIHYLSPEAIARSERTKAQSDREQSRLINLSQIVARARPRTKEEAAQIERTKADLRRAWERSGSGVARAATK
jgi:hypothetical protein